MKKLISIFGSTGSIGLTTLKIIDKKNFFFKPYIFSANKNYSLICKQIKKYNPVYFIITDRVVFKKVKEKFKNKRKTKILNDINILKLKKKVDIIAKIANIAAPKVDITITAIPGIEGLEQTLYAVKISKKILIANKESIITGWNLIKKNQIKYKTKVIPIDSEHFSILKLLQKIDLKDIFKIYITASGGPFLNYNFNKLKKVKSEEALKHPKWRMGKKISIDSATLMNKVLEVIEAQKIFNLPLSKIDILIHPQSLVHAIIKLNNGLTYFIYHETSMIIPIANAIFENNFKIDDFYKLKKSKVKNNIENLEFRKVCFKLFPTVNFIKEMNRYPSAPIIVNASNEVLVDQFLRKNIDYLTIFRSIKTILNDRNYKKYAIRRPQKITEIKEIDKWAKKTTLERLIR